MNLEEHKALEQAKAAVAICVDYTLSALNYLASTSDWNAEWFVKEFTRQFNQRTEGADASKKG